MKAKRLFISLSVLTLLFALPATAIASSAAQSGYEESAPLGTVAESGNGNAPTEEMGAVPAAAAPESSSVLPFTGLQLAIILLLGIGLVGVGLLARRASHSPGP